MRRSYILDAFCAHCVFLLLLLCGSVTLCESRLHLHVFVIVLVRVVVAVEVTDVAVLVDVLV
jgi:hypothetical protein